MCSRSTIKLFLLPLLDISKKSKQNSIWIPATLILTGPIRKHPFLALNIQSCKISPYTFQVSFPSHFHPIFDLFLWDISIPIEQKETFVLPRKWGKSVNFVVLSCQLCDFDTFLGIKFSEPQPSARKSICSCQKLRCEYYILIIESHTICMTSADIIDSRDCHLNQNKYTFLPNLAKVSKLFSQAHIRS